MNKDQYAFRFLQTATRLEIGLRYGISRTYRLKREVQRSAQRPRITSGASYLRAVWCMRLLVRSYQPLNRGIPPQSD